MQKGLEKYKRILITGGAGFIGGNLIKKLLLETSLEIYNLDKLGYASDVTVINDCLTHIGRVGKDRYKFLKTDLSKTNDTKKAIEKANPELVIHLAAESHVDRSIDDPQTFIDSNIQGTYNLLQACLNHYNKLSIERKKKFKFLHVSTDEVFGSLSAKYSFSEYTRYDPRSPYSATKAASDHLVRAWYHTYNLPILISNCGNNFGPWQYPEKLIPTIIKKAIKNQKIPIYGDGSNIRDWIYVDDHIDALFLIISKGAIGESYCIGANQEKTNIEVASEICFLLDKFRPLENSYKRLLTFVEDRPGHDLRYSIDSSKIKNKLGWKPKYTFLDALKLTVDWYLENENWLLKKRNKVV